MTIGQVHIINVQLTPSRDVTASLMGDPPPGRSALDQRQVPDDLPIRSVAVAPTIDMSFTRIIDLLGVKRIAEVTGVSQRTANRWRNFGKIPVPFHDALVALDLPWLTLDVLEGLRS